MQNVTIFAGVQRSRSGAVVPTGIGRVCYWHPNPDGPPADEYTSFGAYQRTLTLKCESGDPGFITWRPDENTPDTVYYQCFTHRYLGWKINVLDHCDSGRQASDVDEVFVEPDEIAASAEDVDTLVPDASIRHETKILPNELFLLQHEKNLLKNHNMNEQPPKIQFDLNKNSEISKIIADGIRAAEALEESIAQSKGNYSYKYESPTKQYGKARPTTYSTIPPRDIQMPDEPSPGAPKFQSHPLSTYNRPPGGFPSDSPPPPPQFHRPVKQHKRRPVFVERRRPFNGGPPPPRPFPPSAAQQSVNINHYKKPGPPYMRPPFVKQQKPVKPPYMLLGQPTEIGPSRKNFEHKPVKPPPPPVQSLKNGVKPPNKMPPLPPPTAPQQSKQPYREPPHKHNVNGKKPQGHINQSVPFRKKPNRESTFKNKEPIKVYYKTPYEVTDDSSVAVVPAHNTGFKPDSVIVEGGFRPIVQRRNDDTAEFDLMPSNRRRDDNISDIDEAMEGDALFINQNVDHQAFEPMFIPSPLDSVNSSHKNRMRDSDLINGDLHDMEVEEGDDKLAMAGERVDAYYLPPDTRKKPAKIYPEGSVVTYDGKAVLDMSLVNLPPPPPPPKGKITYSAGHLSRSEQLVRNSPQYGPFTGEMPPPIPEFVGADGAPQFAQLNSASNKSQIPITEYTNPLTSNTNPISTKLLLARDSSPSDEETQNADDDDNESS